jgi:hypothetical protein
MNLPPPQEQFASAERVDPLFVKLCGVHGFTQKARDVAERVLAKPEVEPTQKSVFVKNPLAPRCPWPRVPGHQTPRDWMLFSGLPSRHITVSEIISAVAVAFDVSLVEIMSHRRPAQVVLARQVAMYLSRELTLLSLPAIGRRINGRDHTTILHGVRKIAARIVEDESLSAKVNEIRARLEAVA